MSVPVTPLVTFQDTDAVVSYTPSTDDPLNGWHTVYERTQPSIGPPGSLEGVGSSFHETRVGGATLSFEFYGTSLTLFGAANGSTYTVTLDDQPTPAHNETDGVLATFDHLTLATHSVKLTVIRPSPTFKFYNATFDTTIESDVNKTTAYNSDIGLWSFNNDWWSQTNEYPSGLSQSVMVTHTIKATAWLTFHGSAIWLYGVRVSDHGAYQIVLDDNTTDFNGKSNYTIPNSLLFFQAGLDPRAPHILTIRNAADAFLDFEIAYYTTSNMGASPNQHIESISSIPVSTSSAGGSPLPQSTGGRNGPIKNRSSPNVGAIVGGVFGSIISLLLLTVLYLYLSNRRSRRRAKPTLYTDRYPFALDVASSSRTTTPEPSFRDDSILQSQYFPHAESLPPPSPTRSFTTDVHFPPELRQICPPVPVATRNAPPPVWRQSLPSRVGPSARDSYSTWYPDRVD